MSQALTLKAEHTRQRIYDTAIRLFKERGYDNTTMREIATEADCSLGLAYKYFESKEDIVVHLYRELAVHVANYIGQLPPAPMSQRFFDTMQEILRTVAPYRGAWVGIFGAAMNPTSPVSVLGDRMFDLRAQMRIGLEGLVSGASDAPKLAEQTRALGLLLYVAHLLLLLFWIADRSAENRLTQQMLELARDLFNMLRPAMVMPPIAKGILRVASILEPVFIGEKPA
jgi:AcrR family transcriptional regulator